MDLDLFLATLCEIVLLAIQLQLRDRTIAHEISLDEVLYAIEVVHRFCCYSLLNIVVGVLHLLREKTLLPFAAVLSAVDFIHARLEAGLLPAT